MAADDENVSLYQLENSAEHSLALSLFVDVLNTTELLQHAVDGKIEAALLKPSMIADPFQVIVAAHKAIHLFTLQKTKTKTLHSEIIFSLSPTNNITDSFKKFGISDKDTTVLVVTIITGNGIEKIKSINQYVKGTQVPVSHLSSVTDRDNIKKVYKIQESEMKIGSLLDAVVCRMAAKDCI